MFSEEPARPPNVSWAGATSSPCRLRFDSQAVLREEERLLLGGKAVVGRESCCWEGRLLLRRQECVHRPSRAGANPAMVQGRVKQCILRSLVLQRSAISSHLKRKGTVMRVLQSTSVLCSPDMLFQVPDLRGALGDQGAPKCCLELGEPLARSRLAWRGKLG